MALTQKPKKDNSKDSNVEEFISAGLGNELDKATGDVSEENIKYVQLRLYPDEIKKIDDYLESLPRRNRPSRHSFIVNAILEKVNSLKS